MPKNAIELLKSGEYGYDEKVALASLTFLETVMMQTLIGKGVEMIYRSEHTDELICRNIYGHPIQELPKHFLVGLKRGEDNEMKLDNILEWPLQTADNLIELTRQWGHDVGIIDQSTVSDQMVKLMSEVGELADAISKNKSGEVMDAFGDIMVVIINLAEMMGMNLVDALGVAVATIYTRKEDGRMVNGKFVKKKDLDEMDI